MMQQFSHSQTKTIAFPSLLPFLLISFGIAWGLFGLFLVMGPQLEKLFGPLSGHHPLFILAVYAPAIAALFVVAQATGTIGLRGFLSRLLLWRCSVGWYVFLVLGIPAIYVLGFFIKTGELPGLTPGSAWMPMLEAMAFMLVLGPVEELGWRSVALPLLQQRFAPVWAGSILGVIWGVWHLPAFGLSGTPQSGWSFLPFLIGSIAVSVILTPLFNASRGSILLSALFHFQLNNPFWPDAQPFDMYVFVVAALVVVWLHRQTMLNSTPHQVTSVNG